MALKPVPKLILIAVIVGGVGYGATKFMPASAPAQAAAPIEAPTVVAPPTAQVQEARAVPAPAPAPVSEPVQQAPERTFQAAPAQNDAGMNALLGLKKK
jgi:hypothetical protein